jgi:hypothetical protein
MAGASDSSSGTDYINLSYREKVKYQGRGFVYHPKMRVSRNGKRMPMPDDAWQLEWSSGIYKPSGRLKYWKVSIRGTKQQARDLLDIIVQVPRRTAAEASDAIEPYIEWRKVTKSGAMKRHAKEYIPVAIPNYHLRRRELIILDYHRIKLLDAMAKLCRELGNYECEGDGVGMETATLRP